MARWSWVDYPKGAILSLLTAGAVIGSVWVPELSHWYVDPMRATPTLVETAQKSPSFETLEEIGDMHLAAVLVPQSQSVSTAEQIMRGTVSVPGFDPAPVTLPFSPDDLVRGLPTWQLGIASLLTADALLDAYRQTRREEFFLQARDVIVAFARFESEQWVDHGLMWNDHAVSARIPVLVKFWALYRGRPDFDADTARLVLDLVSRSAQLLSKPSFYAWRTSHGTITDLALLQLTAAFPQLPGAAEFKAIAVERFRNHLAYWINEEGVTLLHSAGYHAGSLYHFGLALRLYTLNGLKIPDEWWTRYAKAVDFYTQLRRPDGTLPMFGDTSSLADASGPRLTARNETDGTAEPLRQRQRPPPSNPLMVYPVAGHSIWWSGLNPTDPIGGSNAAQTVVTWSYHPGVGHKVADEPSVMLWASGRTWLTNTGYWPYGVPGRESGESWEASNAPHLLGEKKDSERTSHVRTTGSGRGLEFIDVERKGPSGFAVSRQVVHMPDEQAWIVLDSFTDATAQTATTNWTFYPDLAVTPLSDGQTYQVTAPNSTLAMVVSFTGSNGFTAEAMAGSMTPFAGWVVLDRTPARASAIVSRQPSRDSWSLASFSLVGTRQIAAVGQRARMNNWVDAEHWTMLVPTSMGEVQLTRTGTLLVSRREGVEARKVEVELAARIAPAAEAKAVQDAFALASTTYQRFPEIISYRIKMTRYLLIALIALVAQEAVLFAMRRRLLVAGRFIRAAGWIAWTMAGVWLWQIYFVVTP